MAVPLLTVPIWVPNIQNPRILFITENYPSNLNSLIGNTYFYRTLIPGIVLQGANNLLNNLCRAMSTPSANEADKLNNFMHTRRYFLLDTFHSGGAMSQELINTTVTDIGWIDQILDDITFLNPEQIVFTCVGSNGQLLPVLQNRANDRGITILRRLIAPPGTNGQQVFKSPSNRWFHDQNIRGVIHSGFNSQIQQSIAFGILTP